MPLYLYLSRRRRQIKKKIVLGTYNTIYTGRASQRAKEKTFHCHSVSMRIQSKYFDSMLSSGMKKASEKKVFLDGVDPEIFELAMELLEEFQPETKNIVMDKDGAKRVLQIAEFYYAYEFMRGLQEAAKYLAIYIGAEFGKKKGTVEQAEEFDFIATVIVLVMDASLKDETLVEACIEAVKRAISRENSYGFGIVKDEVVLQKLHRFLIQNCEQVLYEFNFDENLNATTGIQFELDKELVEKPEYPSILYRQLKLHREAMYVGNMDITLHVRLLVDERKEVYGISHLPFSRQAPHDYHWAIPLEGDDTVDGFAHIMLHVPPSAAIIIINRKYHTIIPYLMYLT
jgi:hypothetical protein